MSGVQRRLTPAKRLSGPSRVRVIIVAVAALICMGLAITFSTKSMVLTLVFSVAILGASFLLRSRKRLQQQVFSGALIPIWCFPMLRAGVPIFWDVATVVAWGVAGVTAGSMYRAARQGPVPEVFTATDPLSVPGVVVMTWSVHPELWEVVDPDPVMRDELLSQLNGSALSQVSLRRGVARLDVRGVAPGALVVQQCDDVATGSWFTGSRPAPMVVNGVPVSSAGESARKARKDLEPLRLACAAAQFFTEQGTRSPELVWVRSPAS